MAKVSVIMPVFNGARFVREAIESLLAQEFEDWELLITDDGSTDATPVVLSRFTDPRVRVFRQPNGGEASARNAALDRASGEIIAFLDADDLYLPTALANMTAYLNAHPQYGVVFSNGYVIDENGKRRMTLTEHRPAIYTGNILEHIVLDAAVVTVPVCVAARRSVIEQIGARFDTALGYGTDWDFWIQLARVTQFGYLDTFTCQYRAHPTNMTSTVDWNRRKKNLAAGRRKVMQADWFASLSLNTRYSFLYYLIIHLLDSASQEQQAMMQDTSVRSLPGWMQSCLWRQISLQALRRRELPESRAYLQTALQAHPGNVKTRLLLLLTGFGAHPANLTASIWQALHKAVQQFRRLGRKQSRPMPHQISFGNSSQ